LGGGGGGGAGAEEREAAVLAAARRHESRETKRASCSQRKRDTAMVTKKGGGGRRKLAEYRRKRDFTRTAEPEGVAQRPTPAPPKRRGRSRLRFVVQKHAASQLHFDFRLELDGVMKSWAVPKGPSYDPSIRRLAMEVEDHPIEYNTFEGTIPQGEYGGGTVMLWDRGTYDAEDGGGADSLREGYVRGDLKFVLDGARLRGGWVLVRMKRPGRPQWLLIKHRDAFARPAGAGEVVDEETTSVATGRSMDEIAAGKKAVRRPRRPAHSSRRASSATRSTKG